MGLGGNKEENPLLVRAGSKLLQAETYIFLRKTKGGKSSARNRRAGILLRKTKGGLYENGYESGDGAAFEGNAVAVLEEIKG